MTNDWEGSEGWRGRGSFCVWRRGWIGMMMIMRRRRRAVRQCRGRTASLRRCVSDKVTRNGLPSYRYRRSSCSVSMGSGCVDPLSSPVHSLASNRLPQQPQPHQRHHHLRHVEVDIYSPLQSEKEAVDWVRVFIARGQEALSGIIDLDKIDKVRRGCATPPLITAPGMVEMWWWRHWPTTERWCTIRWWCRNGSQRHSVVFLCLVFLIRYWGGWRSGRTVMRFGVCSMVVVVVVGGV